MNEGALAGTMVAVLAGAARKRVVAHFLAQHAIGAEDAVPYLPTGVEKSQFRYLLDKGVLREASPGSYWLDRAALEAIERRQRAWLMPLVALLLAAIAGLILLVYR